MTLAESRKLHRRWWTLAVVATTLALAAMDTTIVNVAIPEIQDDLDASASSLQWIVDAYYLVFAGMLLVMGVLGDKFGRRLILQTGVLIFGGANLWAAFAGSPEALIAARALTGVGAAMMMPATLSIIVDVFPLHERAKAIAIWSAAAGIGVPVGQILGGFLLEQFAWGSIFFVAIPVCALILVTSRFLIPESRDPQAPPLDLAGAALSTGAFSAFIFAIIEAPQHGWTSERVLGGFLVAILAGAAFVFLELRLRAPMVDLRLLRNRSMATGAAAITVSFMVLLGGFFVLTQFLQIVRGYSALETGLILTPTPVAFAIASMASEGAVTKWGMDRVTTVGLALCSLALVPMAFFDETTTWWEASLALSVLGFGVGAVMAPATAAMMRAVPDAKAGLGGAMNEQTRLIGIALGVSVFGSIVNTVYSNDMAGRNLGLDPAAASTASDSVGGALQVTRGLDPGAGADVFALAQNAFVDGLNLTMIVGAVIALVGAVIIGWAMPGRASAEASDALPGILPEFEGEA